MTVSEIIEPIVQEMAAEGTGPLVAEQGMAARRQ